MDTNTTPAQAIEQQPIIVQAEAPWLQQNGKYTPEEYLKILTPEWSSKTWEKYLSWFENQSGTRAESIVNPKRYDSICEEQEESIFAAYSQTSADGELKAIISKFLLRLTPQQRRVIEMIFWEGRSERYVAQALEINQQPVNRLKKRALNKIKHLLSEGVSSRIMKGENPPIMNEGGTNAENLSLAKSPMAEAG